MEPGISRPAFLKADYPGRTGDPEPFGVRLNLTIDARGVPRDIQAADSADSERVKRAATIVSKWRFTPGLRDGQPAPVSASFLLAHGGWEPGVRTIVRPAKSKK